MYKHVSLMYDAGFIAILILLNTYRTYCHLILYDTFVIDLWYMLTTDTDTCSTCYRSMHYATMQYCIVWGSLWDHQYEDHQYHSLSTLCDSPNVLRDRYKA